MSLTESLVEDAALTWFLLCPGSGGQVGELVPRGAGLTAFNAPTGTPAPHSRRKGGAGSGDPAYKGHLGFL